MRKSLGIAGIFLTLTVFVQGIEEPSLPTWDPAENSRLKELGWVPGAVLLTDDPIPDEANPSENQPLVVESPKPEEIAEDFKPSKDIPESFLPAYFAERPATFLVDPQNLLGTTQFRDRLGFLNYHASDSAVDLFVYVIGGEQDIPSDVREEELIERFFTVGRPALVVFYYLGAPQRSVVYLSPSITDAVSAPEQRRALESSVLQALDKSSPLEQLEKFLVQMSIRIYWMERMLAGDAVSTGSETLAAIPQSSENKARTSKSKAYLWVVNGLHEFATPIAVGLLSLMIAFGIRFTLHRGSRFTFPEFEVESRLGGPHGAGVGAVISFSSAALPPALQRDQVPDYLRRA